MQKNFFKNAVSKSKSFFEKIWNKIKTFVSEHKPFFGAISEIFIVVFLLAWATLMLYQLSLGLLTGIEKASAIHIALAILGFILVTIVISLCAYWVIFAKSYDKELLQIRRYVSDIRLKQTINSFDDSLTRTEFKVSMIEQKLDIENKLEKIERKIDKLTEQK